MNEEEGRIRRLIHALENGHTASSYDLARVLLDILELLEGKEDKTPS